MSEMEDTANDFVVIAKGRVVASGTGAEGVKGVHASLEDAFFALTDEHTEYRAASDYPGTGAGERQR